MSPKNIADNRKVKAAATVGAPKESGTPRLENGWHESVGAVPVFARRDELNSGDAMMRPPVTHRDEAIDLCWSHKKQWDKTPV